jgi:flagellar hook-length control protein FliK
VHQVASHAGVIHSQNNVFHGRSRPPGLAEQPASPFSLLLDDAGEAPPLPAKNPPEQPQASHVPLPQSAEQLTPDQTKALATPLSSENEKAAENTKTAAEIATATEIGTVAILDENQSDTADASDASAITAVLIQPGAPQLPAQQPTAAVIIGPVAPLEIGATPTQLAEQPIAAVAAPPDAQSAPAQAAAADAMAVFTPSQTQPEVERPIPDVTAPAAPSDQAAAPQSAAKAPDTAPASSAEVQTKSQQPSAGGAPLSQPAPELQQTAATTASATPLQPQPISTETAEPEAAVPDHAPAPDGDGPKGTARSDVAIDRSESKGLPNPIGPGANGLQKAAAAQSSNKGRGANTEQKNSLQPANVGSADGAPDEGQAEPTTAGKKEHLAVVSTASRVGAPGIDSPSASRSEAHGTEAAPAGKNLEAVQVINLQAPADRVATPVSPIVQPASSHDATAAAVPLAGLAVEIAARAKTEGNRFEIRLDPPELGRIDVRLDIDHSGHVTSRLLVDRVETLDALRRDAGGLERALQQAGLKTADNGLQFALRDQSFAGRGHNLPTPGAARVIVPASELPAIDTAQAGYGRLLRSGGIDIRV